jgi:hypothetical protein
MRLSTDEFLGSGPGSLAALMVLGAFTVPGDATEGTTWDDGR